MVFYTGSFGAGIQRAAVSFCEICVGGVEIATGVWYNKIPMIMNRSDDDDHVTVVYVVCAISRR